MTTTILTLPRLTRSGDRLYRLADGDVGTLRSYLESRGFHHTAPKAGDLYAHRWLAPDRSAVVVLFSDGRLVVLGRTVAELDALVVESGVAA